LAFRVDITDAALADAEDFVEYVRREKRDTVGAERWWNGLLDALFSLEQQPGRAHWWSRRRCEPGDCAKFSINPTVSYLTWMKSAR
jgi:hypothetical protein